jgi:hypothetical protein
MNKDYQSTIELNSVSVTVSKKREKNERLVLAYDSTFENSVKYLMMDSNSDVFYLGISKKSGEEKEEEKEDISFCLTVEELKMFIKHGKKLIRQLKEKEFYEI